MMLSRAVTHLKRERKRKVKIRVLPDEGYDIDVQLERDTPIEKILSTLEELGFKYLSEEKPLYDEKHGVNTEKLIEDIYNKFMLITQEYGVSITSSEKFYESWINMGFDIVDLKNAIGVYIPFLSEGESDSGINNAIGCGKLENGSHESNALSSFRDVKETSLEHDTDISPEESASDIQIQPILLDSGQTAIIPPEIEERASEIRPLFGLETSDSCKYCSVCI